MSMNLQKFGEKLPAIVALYEEHCLNNQSKDTVRRLLLRRQEIIDMLEQNWFAEFRIGSRWDSQSKLSFSYNEGAVWVFFLPNFDTDDRNWTMQNEADKQKEIFETAVKKILDGE